MDDILLAYDIAICQAQGNDGTQLSAAQAWAKNIISVGGIRHHDNPDKTAHEWNEGASIGPATDGRVKPDLTHFFDGVFSTTWRRLTGWCLIDGQPCSPCTENHLCGFGGTSAATPLTCGHMGLFFEMWADGIFGNVLLDPNCDPQVENCVFKNRSHMTTAKAMVINSAWQYPFQDPPPPDDPDDKTRVHQGWGLIDVGRLYLLRETIPVIIDESEILDTPGQAVVRNVSVPGNTHALRATLVYADPPGSGAVQEQHAVNDLTLKVTAPDGTTHYWGNCGLRESNWSSSACTEGDHPFLFDPDDEVIDTVENVFVQNPAVGTWTVRVIADAIVQDAHLETAGTIDADFALVVSIDPDCNQNLESDPDEILRGVANDCNGNGVPDSCDLGAGTSLDCDGTGVPDECEGCPAGCLCGGGCYQCCTDAQCGAGQVCCGNVCRSWECCDDSDCGGATPYCLAATHECVECTTDAHCAEPTPACLVSTHTCVECVDDSHCTDPEEPYCGYELDPNVCVECNVDSHCPGFNCYCLETVGDCTCCTGICPLSPGAE